MVNVALWTRFYVGSKIVALATDDVNGTWVGKVYDQLWTVDETADVFELLSAGNVTDFTNTEVSERVNVNYGLGVDEDVVIGSFYNGFDGRSVTVYHLYKDGTLAVEVL